MNSKGVIMKIALDSEIESTYKRIKSNNTLHVLQPLVEAIKNSLQADATIININIKSINNNLIGGSPSISEYEIEDNGVGFLEEDIDVFSTLKKKHNNNKNKLGCKGFSRIVSLVYFNKLNINTYNGTHNYNIDFSSNFDDKNNIKSSSSTNSSGTTIKYTSIKDKYIIKNIDEIKEYISSKLYIFLSLKENIFNININFDNKKIVINNDNFKNKLDKKDFKLYDNKFTLHYSIIKNPQAFSNINGLCAHNEKVKDIIKGYAFSKNYSYIFLITGKLLDDSVTDERTNFELITDLLNDITLEDIENKFLELLNEIISTLPECEQKELIKEKELQKINFINDFPYLKHFLQDKDLNNFKNDYYIEANNLLQKELKESREIKNKILSEEITESVRNKVINSNILNETLLAQYIYYRDTIITYLQKLSSSEAKETALHRLFDANKQKDTNNKYPLLNTWLLDDAFMTYTNFLTEAQIKTIIKEGDNKDRVDIFISFNKENEKEPEKCVLIEFKDLKKERNTNENAKVKSSADQLKSYAKKIKDKYPKLNYIYAYAILGFDDEFKQILKDDNYLEAFTKQGTIFWQSFTLNKDIKGKEFALVINFLEVDNIIADAKARNKTFLDILKNKP